MLVYMWLYKIRLFVVVKTVLVGEDHILPYQSYAPDGRLLTLLQSIEIDPGPPLSPLQDMVDPSSSGPETSHRVSASELALLKDLEAFDPFPSVPQNLNTIADREASLKRTVGAYIMAIQFAARITLFRTPSDEWETRLTMSNLNPCKMSAFSPLSQGEAPPNQADKMP